MAILRDQHDARSNSQNLLIYDGECRLCVAAKEKLERHSDRQKVRFIPYGSTEAANILGKAYKPGRPEVAFFVDSSGEIQRGLDAFIPLLTDLTGGRIILKLWHIRIFRPFAYAAYRLIANNRYRWFSAQ